MDNEPAGLRGSCTLSAFTYIRDGVAREKTAHSDLCAWMLWSAISSTAMLVSVLAISTTSYMGAVYLSLLWILVAVTALVVLVAGVWKGLGWTALVAVAIGIGVPALVALAAVIFA
jgi:hypothetical protein